MTKSLDIFDFLEYRQYLKRWFEEARLAGTSNISRISERLGVHTSFLAHVLSGNKNLSFEHATELSEIFGHTDLEREYFFSLLQIERAGTHKLKAYWEKKKRDILEQRTKIKSRVGAYKEFAAEHKAIFYSSWIYLAVFVSTAINDGQTLEQIADFFNLSRNRAEEILNFLLQTGICRLDGAKYKMGPSRIFVGNDSPFVIKHHTNWRIKAIEKMDKREQRDLFYTAPMSMSVSDFQKVRELLSKAIQSSLDICHLSAAEDVVCLNIDFFSLLK